MNLIKFEVKIILPIIKDKRNDKIIKFQKGKAKKKREKKERFSRRSGCTEVKNKRETARERKEGGGAHKRKLLSANATRVNSTFDKPIMFVLT